MEAQELLATFRVVIISGARQVGKSTLASALLGVGADRVFSLDDPLLRARATNDPTGFVEALPHGSVIDEFQRAGEGLLLAVKLVVDRDPAKGRFILTGSTNYLAARGVTETLAGRTGRLQLWPLSVGERAGRRERFLDRLFSGDWVTSTAPATTPDRTALLRVILEGGYPEVVRDALPERRRARWFDGYLADVVNREALRPVADVRLEHELRRVLRAVAARVGGELVIADVARDLGLDRATVTSYVSLLEALHLLHLLPGYASSATTAARQRPAIYLVDSGLAAHINGVGEREFAAVAGHRFLGPLVEQFVVAEVLKQTSWAPEGFDVYHFRDRQQREVDIVIEERRSGRIAGIEVKATATPDARAARHLAYLRDRTGDAFAAGVVLHTGSVAVPLGDRLWALPITSLWE